MTRRRVRRAIATVVMCAAVPSAALVAGAPSAGAAAAASKASFCKVLTDQNQTDLEGLNPDSADFALKQIKKLLKAGPPKKVKKALKRIQAAYEQIRDGKSRAEAIGSAKTLAAFSTYGSYVSKNCRGR
jgi:hypothetical protein